MIKGFWLTKKAFEKYQKKLNNLNPEYFRGWPIVQKNNKGIEILGGLKLPKYKLVIMDAETGQIIAENGRWKKLPNEGHILRAYYKNNLDKYGRPSTFTPPNFRRKPRRRIAGKPSRELKGEGRATARQLGV